MMSERVSAVSNSQNPSPPHSPPLPPTPYFCLKVLVDSLKIFPRNKRLFLSIYALLAFPLSFLVFALSFSSFPPKAYIVHLEYLASFSSTRSTRFEARHVFQESRAAAISLLHVKLLHFLPCYLLSLVTAVSSIVSAHHYYNHHRQHISLKSAIAAVKPTWVHPVVTSVCTYAVLLLYSTIPLVLSAVIARTDPGLGFAVRVIGYGVEVYLMAVMGMALVASILDRKYGWEAIRVGWDLMEGRRVCGWALSGLLAVAIGGIGWRMEELMTEMMQGVDLSREVPSKWTAAMEVEGWDRVGLVGLYGLVVVWGYVVSTVFYCECRKRHAGREEEGEEGEEMNEKIDNC